MNILMLTSTDPAGTAILFTHALNRATDHTCRLITTARVPGFECDFDLHEVYDDLQEVHHLLKHADVFHFHKMFEEEMTLGPYRVRDYVRGKKVVYHIHGHPRERQHPERVRARLSRAPCAVAVSTPDLRDLYPSASWIPNTVPLRDPLYLPRACDRTVTRTVNGDVCIVGHSPTNTAIKRSDDFVQACKELAPRHRDMRVEINMGLTQRENLLRKRAWNVSVDTLVGGFGMNSLESLCHAIPVVANLREIELCHLREFTGRSDHPWVQANDVSTLCQALDGLLVDRARRREIGEASREWMERYMTQDRIVERLLDLYRAAPVRVARRWG